MNPNLFIVGAPKCGTTSMHEYLGQHPDICFPERKEPKFFGTDLHITDRRSPEEYMALFEGINGARYTGESMVYKLFSTQAAIEIKERFPDSKIIIMLRNPVDFMNSLYYQNRYEAIENSPTFLEALSNESAVKRNFEQVKRRINMPHRLLYRENARFHAQVKRYYDAFEQENVLVISFTDFVKNTEETYRRTLDFLDLPHHVPEFPKANPAKLNRSVLLRNLMKKPPKPLRKIFAIIFSENMKKRIHRKTKFLNTVPVEKQSIDPGARKTLMSEFAPEIEAIHELTGVKID